MLSLDILEQSIDSKHIMVLSFIHYMIVFLGIYAFFTGLKAFSALECNNNIMQAESIVKKCYWKNIKHYKHFFVLMATVPLCFFHFIKILGWQHSVDIWQYWPEMDSYGWAFLHLMFSISFIMYHSFIIREGG